MKRNSELTAKEVGFVLRKFENEVNEARQEYSNHMRHFNEYKGHALQLVIGRCAELEVFLTDDLNEFIKEVENLNENSLAYLMDHYCAVDPKFMEEVNQLITAGPKATPNLLTDDEVERHSAISSITKNFLDSMNKGRGQRGPQAHKSKGVR